MNLAALHEIGQQENERQAAFDLRLFCCTSTACLANGASATADALRQEVEARRGQGASAEAVHTGCLGLCSRGPLARVDRKDGPSTLFHSVTPEVARQIVAQQVDGRAADLAGHILPPDLPFFARQVRVVLEEIGRIDPESLEDYIAHGGYAALARALHEMTPEQVCDEIQASQLRGRGGAGFPTGTKWHYVRREPGDQKYVVVNGDEGDPGAYMDRTVMEDSPHRVLEGMLIAAYAVGARSGYFYVRGEYPTAVERLRRAIRAARRHGLLGRRILETDFEFNAEVRIGAGAFVCGEETALLHSIEGRRGTPRMRPPYPSTRGLWGCPTVINNVETCANVPSILTRGSGWFAGIGTETSKGTKVFALAGQLTNTGLIEVPMGITLREVVYEIGGGVPNGRAFKAAQTGGPSGGCLAQEHLDVPIDYETLTKLGTIMGSGGLVIIDETTSMPEFARFFIDFCVDESCGKCVPCRAGTVQIRALMDKILEDRASADDIDRLEKLCRFVKRASLCGLGQSAPNPVLSTLRYFRHEYEPHLQKEPAHAPAG
jgi:bidirectional [NiFe] hydrogenase diaphorase subunit